MAPTTHRIAGYDIARILACSLIFLSHTPGSLAEIYGSELACVYISSLADSGINIFFMISGGFLLGHNESAHEFFRRRFFRILLPMALFTVGYALLEVKVGGSLYTILTRVAFEGVVNPAFWFLYTLCGLYLVTPILSRWLTSASHREVAFYLMLWLITTCFPFYEAAFGYNPNDSSLFRLLTGYTGAYVAGYYIRRYINPASRPALILIVSFGLCALLVPYIEMRIGKGWYGIWNGEFNCAVLGIAVLLLILRISGQRKSSPALAVVANLTLGMYLFNTVVNFFIGRWGLTEGLSLHEGYVLFFLTSLFSALGVSFICSRIPLLREAIGFRSTAPGRN